MRELIHQFLSEQLDRRALLERLTAIGLTSLAAQNVLAPLEASERIEQAGSFRFDGTGGALVVEQARAAGVEFMFTNPGSFEVGLFDALVDHPSIRTVMGLHEGIVISMADGYHRVSLKPAFVNVHVIAGTAQMAGQLYNASRDGSALVITAGLLDNELWSDDASLAPRPGYDQKEVCRQFTRISWEARRAESLPLMLRRAFKMAATEPGGPVYLAMAHYALETKRAQAEIVPASRFLYRVEARPAKAAVERAAKLLVEARRPIVVAGDEVWKSGAQQQLVDLAERLGLPVMAATQGYRNFPTRHTHSLGSFSPEAAFVKKGVDLILCVGSRDFGGRVIPASPEVPGGATIVRVGLDTPAMGRNYPTDLALVADVKSALIDLCNAVDGMLTNDRRRALAASRAGEFRGMGGLRSSKVNFGRSPMHPDEIGAIMARTLDRNAILVSENLTARYDACSFGFREDEMTWIGNTGNGLGWGLGAAAGAQLAAPDRQVVCSIGDGSVMYSASGFWSYARYGLPVLTVVWNNRNYQTVRHAYHSYGGRMASSGHYACMYLGNPDIDFVKLAESQGVKGERAATAAEFEAALKRGVTATRNGEPYLVEVLTARYGGGAESTWHEPFRFQKRGKA